MEQELLRVGEQVAVLLRKDLVDNDAASLLRLARERGVEGLVADSLVRSVPDESSRSVAKEAYVRNFCQSAAYQHRLKDLELAFRSAGIEAIALKGLPLSMTLYGSSIGSRELSDIDLVFRPEQLGEAREVIEGLGYLLRGDTDMGYHKDGYFVDLHVRLMDRVDRAYRFELENVWAGRERFHEEFEAIQGLGPDQNFCYLAVHGMDHGFSRLKWIVDLALLLPQCQGSVLRQRALDSNSLGTISVALAVLRELLDVSPPSELTEDLSRMTRFEKSFVQRIVANSLPAESGKFFAVWNAPTLASKAEVLRRVAKVDGESWSYRIRRVLKALKGLVTRR